MAVDEDDLRLRLRRHGQEQVLRFWDELSVESRSRLSAQIRAIDLEQLERLVQGHDETPDWSGLAARARPPRAIRLDTSQNEFQPRDAVQRGEQALRDGQFGLILVAGGQGTRLGFDHPKGMFPLGPVSGRTLFQILFERIQAIARRFQVRIPLYLMTSPATDLETRLFLAERQWFGLPPGDVHVFCQGVMPAVDQQTGRLLLAERDSLALSPDGHGGTLAAFCQSGCMQDAIGRGVEHLFYFQVDNPLARICDPLLVGYHLLADSDMTTQVVHKRTAAERVGNVVEIDGRTQIIEYSDLPGSVAEQRNEDGSLRLWAGNLAIHVFRRSFLERASSRADALPFHRALKKVDFVDDEGSLVSPHQANAVKFERFIFDLLPLARNALVVESDPADSFAPVKNAEGAAGDTPASAQAAMIARDARLLRDAGVHVASNTPVEVSPLWALDAAEAALKVTPGQQIAEPTYFGPDSR